MCLGVYCGMTRAYSPSQSQDKLSVFAECFCRVLLSSQSSVVFNDSKKLILVSSRTQEQDNSGTGAKKKLEIGFTRFYVIIVAHYSQATHCSPECSHKDRTVKPGDLRIDSAGVERYRVRNRIEPDTEIPNPNSIFQSDKYLAQEMRNPADHIDLSVTRVAVFGKQ